MDFESLLVFRMEIYHERKSITNPGIYKDHRPAHRTGRLFHRKRALPEFKAQKQTSDALSRIYQRGSISFSGVQDVRGSLKRLEIGGSLSTLELLRIAKLLETTSRVKSFGRLENSDREKDSLDDMFDNLQPLSGLYNEIYRCILSEDEIGKSRIPQSGTGYDP